MKRHLANFHIAGFAYWDGCEAFEQLKIGFIPRGSNQEISKYLDMGWDDLYEVRITRVTPDAHPESQVEVVVHIKRNIQE